MYYIYSYRSRRKQLQRTATEDSYRASEDSYRACLLDPLQPVVASVVSKFDVAGYSSFIRVYTKRMKGGYTKFKSPANTQGALVVSFSI